MFALEICGSVALSNSYEIGIVMVLFFLGWGISVDAKAEDDAVDSVNEPTPDVVDESGAANVEDSISASPSFLRRP